MKIIIGTGLAAAALALSEDQPTFRCAAEDTASCAWTLETVREVGNASLSFMGNDQDIGSGSTSTSTLTLEVSEEVRKATEDGAPLLIARSYETITVDAEREGLEESEGMKIRDGGGSSELQGQTVLFEFDPDAEAWTAAFDEDSSGSEEWLDELAPRIDLAGLLPSGDAPAMGDSWEIEPAFLADLIMPGGEIMVESPDDDADIPDGAIAISVPTASDIGQLEELEGEITATFKDVVDDDGRRLARIVIAVDVSAEHDIIDWLEDAALDRGAEETYDNGTLNRTMEGELTLLWDLAGARAAGLEGELTGIEELSAEWSIDAGGNNIAIAVASESDVTKTIEATFAD